MLQEFLNFRKHFVALNAGVALVLVTFLWLLGWHEPALGLMMGFTVAVLSFWVHGNVLSRAFSMPSNRARLYVFINFLARYVLYFFTLLGALQHSPGHFWGAVGGLLVPRLVILVFYTFNLKELMAAIKSNPSGNE